MDSMEWRVPDVIKGRGHAGSTGGPMSNPLHHVGFRLSSMIS